MPLTHNTRTHSGGRSPRGERGLKLSLLTSVAGLPEVAPLAGSVG